jgi:mono/diheme cytochrome c family protein
MHVKAIALALLVATAYAAQAPSARKTVWNGAYTEAQADRGQKAYIANCGGCHQANLGGKGEIPALRGDPFMERWRDYSARPLFDLIKNEMPPLRFRTPETKPLPDDVYADIISYLFQVNSFPAGNTELAVEALDTVQIVAKTGAQPPPQFALVSSVGCMRYRPPAWRISRATEPVRATMPDVATGEEIDRAKTRFLGSRDYRLTDFGYLGREFEPAALEDRKILVKGYIIRQKEFDRISVTSIADLGDCE